MWAKLDLESQDLNGTKVTSKRQTTNDLKLTLRFAAILFIFRLSTCNVLFIAYRQNLQKWIESTNLEQTVCELLNNGYWHLLNISLVFQSTLYVWHRTKVGTYFRSISSPVRIWKIYTSYGPRCSFV